MPVYIQTNIKTFDDIVTDIVDFIEGRAPFADLGANEIYRDILIEAPSSELSKNWQDLQFLSVIQSLDNILNSDNDSEYKTTVADALGITTDELQARIDGHLNNYGENYDRPRLAETFAEGAVTFFTETQPTENINVPQGTVLSTESQVGVPGLNFETTRDATLDAGSVDSFFNVETGFYELEIPVVAQSSGTDSNVPANTIVSVQSTTIPMRVTNRAVLTRGAAKESNESFVARLKTVFTSNFKGTKPGLEQQVRSESTLISDAGASGTGDILQARGAGSIDIYTIGQSLLEFEETFSFVNRADEYVLTQQPTNNVSSVIGSLSGTISSAYYTLVSDTGTRAKSTGGQDKIIWSAATATKSTDAVYGFLTAPTVLPDYVEGNTLSSRIFVFRDGVLDTSNWEYADDTTNQNKIRAGTDVFDSLATYTILVVPEDGDELTVNYWYNGLITTLQTSIASDENHILGQDVLIKEATQVPIDITLTVEANTTVDVSQVRTDVLTVITTYLNTNTLGGEVLQAEIVDAIVGDVEGVTNVQIPFAKLARSGGTGTADISLESNEYSADGVIVINVSVI